MGDNWLHRASKEAGLPWRPYTDSTPVSSLPERSLLGGGSNAEEKLRQQLNQNLGGGSLPSSASLNIPAEMKQVFDSCSNGCNYAQFIHAVRNYTANRDLCILHDSVNNGTKYIVVGLIDDDSRFTLFGTVGDGATSAKESLVKPTSSQILSESKKMLSRLQTKAHP